MNKYNGISINFIQEIVNVVIDIVYYLWLLFYIFLTSYIQD